VGGSKGSRGVVWWVGWDPIKYGRKYRGARRKPHTRGPHAADISSMLGTRSQLVGVFLLRWPQHQDSMLRVRPVQLPPTCAPRHSTDMVCKSRTQLWRRALLARADGPDEDDHLLCEGAVCTRVCDRVLRRCHAALKRRGSELEL